MQATLLLSNNRRRAKQYEQIIQKAIQRNITVADIIQLGYKLMRRARLHYHFFGKDSLVTTAQYLTFYSLHFPYEYDNPKYLKVILDETAVMSIIKLFEKRIANRVPVEYITNEAVYLEYKFYVNHNVIVPRSVMNTRFKDFLNAVQWSNGRVLDLCTGSGCIGITLALLNPNITVDLVDISHPALEVAMINIQRHNLENRVKCICSNLFDKVTDKYDLIIANPPYVSHQEYDASPPEFKREPKIALVAKNRGVHIVRQIIERSKRHLTENGMLIMEVGLTMPKLLKKQYKHLQLKWLPYRRASGKVSLFAKDCIFVCQAKNLPLF